jgi:hypothetical protein
VGSSGNEQPKSVVFRSALSVTVAGVISSGHHVYGALVYGTPWRLVVSLWIPAFVLLILCALYMVWRFKAQRVATIAVWIIMLGGVVFQMGFTLFEAVYSHVLKNFLYFGGATQAILDRLYPAPAYHLPDDLLFEATGVAQVTGFWAAWWAWRVFTERPLAT